MKLYRENVKVDEQTPGQKPCVCGQRITLDYDDFQYIQATMTPEEVGLWLLDSVAPRIVPV